MCCVSGRENILDTIVFITGLTLIVPGLINIVLLLGHRDDSRLKPSATMKVVGWISSVASVALGTFMIVAPTVFTPVLQYMFGGVMILSSLVMVYMMTRIDNSVRLPWWLYVGPVVVLVIGIVMLCIDGAHLADMAVALVTGIAMIVFAVSWFTTGFEIARRRRAARKAEKLAQASNNVTPGISQNATQSFDTSK